MNAEAPTDQDALKALEQFVVDNEELMELEQRIGRFNIFDALGVARVEIRHSNFLAWLLDPGESHGQGALFLRAVLMDLLRQAPVKDRPFSPVQLDGRDMRNVEVRREWRNIDLLITCQDPRFVVAVENKIDSGEHGKQLCRYKKTVIEEFPDTGRLFVFLTKDGSEPSCEQWMPYSYADIHGVLDRCRTTNITSIGKDVAAFLDHYLRLIGSRFMDDPQIADLCQRIYQNHRQALDLIFENCVTSGSPLVRVVTDMLKNDGNRWHVFNSTSRRVDFVPADWLQWLPPLGTRPRKDPKLWFHWSFDFFQDKQQLRLFGIVSPCSDTELRRNTIEALREMGIGKSDKKKPEKKITDRWTTVYNKVVMRWNEEDEPTPDAIEAAVRKSLDLLTPKLKDIPGVLQPILARAEGT